jgi:photosystem II stability/assembly factor-like uncharacterized protein
MIQVTFQADPERPPNIKIITGYQMLKRITGSSLLILCSLFTPLSPSSASEQLTPDRLSASALTREGAEKSLLLSVSNTGKRLVAAGEQGVIVYSDDQGKKWQQASVPASTLLTSIKFTDNQTGWAIGHDGLVLKTTDSGSSWKSVLSGNEINQLRITALENLLGSMTTDNYTPEQIEDTEYALDDAVIAQEEGPTSPLLDMLFLNSSHGFLIGAYGTMLETRDAGQSWQFIGHKLPNPEGFHLNRIYQLKSGRLLILGEAGLLLASDDKGESWLNLDSPYDGSFFSAAESDALYIMGLRGNTFRFDDQNQNWQRVELPVAATINDAIVVEDQIIMVGQGGTLLRQKGTGFEPLGKRQLRTFTSLTQVTDSLIITGETGIVHLSLSGKEAAQ